MRFGPESLGVERVEGTSMLYTPSSNVAYINEAPRIEISRGVVSIQLRSGNDVLEMAMSICNFARSVERSKRALKHYSDGDERVIIDD